MRKLNLTYKTKIQQPNTDVNNVVNSIGEQLAKQVEANVISYEQLIKIHNLATDSARLKNVLRWL